MNIFTLVCIIIPLSSMADDFFSDLAVPDSTPSLLNVTQEDLVTKDQLVFHIKDPQTFNGGTSAFNKKATSANTNMQKDYTIMTWVYIKKRDPRTWVRLVGKGDRAGNTRNFGLWVSSVGTPLSQSLCTTKGQNAYNHSTKVPVGVWTHLTGIFQKDDVHALYMNGKLVQKYPTSGTPCYSPNLEVTVGGGPPGYPTLDGTVRGVRLYNYAISTRDIAIIAGIVTPTPAPTPAPTGEYSSIIALINALIAEGKLEINDINKRIEGLVADVKKHKGIVTTALAKEEVALAAKNEAGRLLAVAEGVAKSTCKRMSETVPGLEKEIKLFNQVIGLLNGLSNGKALVEEDQDKIRSFISLADQADPKKVANVLALVRGLIATANADIAKAKKECKDANDAVAAAQKRFNEASGIWANLVKVREDAEADLSSVQGKLAAAETHADRRIPVINSEIKDLEEVLGLIQSLE